ncbi:hypothetical protein [Dehalococcoides mccartyi]|jgi:hypothetical protein|uniref:hypothetical protein n=1 Tax=Dehalococcoides mccartyi TaxID=61435 RepID=UPI00098F4DA5|nr:hypothetical protein [Dehalococcoides mccartyi]AQU06117.1 hypothetical protein B1777_05380 [Dehalococcoides mccartyi]AQU07560.1 hypothetical protein B1778_05180 [Dehalococcoides mccartyi]AQX74806.1 hypothetical protein B1776_04475 [Dehalococcoides mccartyi]AQY73383.1 hypothetical protein B1772_04785 [Dehalococcoides mccartyi]QBX64083.1 hypothetical protein DhcFL2_04810 [Dehalococcoides mccartyi]
MTKEETNQLNRLSSQVAVMAETMSRVEKYMDEGNKRQEIAIKEAQETADRACEKAIKVQTQVSTLGWVGGIIATLLAAAMGWLIK